MDDGEAAGELAERVALLADRAGAGLFATLIRQSLRRARSPVARVCFVGGTNTGKSQLVNTLVGAALLPVSVRPGAEPPTLVRPYTVADAPAGGHRVVTVRPGDGDGWLAEAGLELVDTPGWDTWAPAGVPAPGPNAAAEEPDSPPGGPYDARGQGGSTAGGPNRSSGEGSSRPAEPYAPSRQTASGLTRANATGQDGSSTGPAADSASIPGRSDIMAANDRTGGGRSDGDPPADAFPRRDVNSLTPPGGSGTSPANVGDLHENSPAPGPNAAPRPPGSRAAGANFLLPGGGSVRLVSDCDALVVVIGAERAMTTTEQAAVRALAAEPHCPPLLVVVTALDRLDGAAPGADGDEDPDGTGGAADEATEVMRRVRHRVRTLAPEALVLP
ncbi:MAG: hypothetical protein HOY69_22100, partial [Streptomyces sp.]|nr:hypothetical protein [Streptomyces sp.]